MHPCGQEIAQFMKGCGGIVRDNCPTPAPERPAGQIFLLAGRELAEAVDSAFDTDPVASMSVISVKAAGVSSGKRLLRCEIARLGRCDQEEVPMVLI